MINVKNTKTQPPAAKSYNKHTTNKHLWYITIKTSSQLSGVTVVSEKSVNRRVVQIFCPDVHSNQSQTKLSKQQTQTHEAEGRSSLTESRQLGRHRPNTPTLMDGRLHCYITLRGEQLRARSHFSDH